MPRSNNIYIQHLRKNGTAISVCLVQAAAKRYLLCHDEMASDGCLWKQVCVWKQQKGHSGGECIRCLDPGLAAVSQA